MFLVYMCILSLYHWPNKKSPLSSMSVRSIWVNQNHYDIGSFLLYSCVNIDTLELHNFHIYVTLVLLSLTWGYYFPILFRVERREGEEERERQRETSKWERHIHWLPLPNALTLEQGTNLQPRAMSLLKLTS